MQESICNWHLTDDAIDHLWSLSIRHTPGPRSHATGRQYATKALRGGASLQEIADALGCNRERVRQIEVQALEKCRRWCECHGYRLGDLLA